MKTSPTIYTPEDFASLISEFGDRVGEIRGCLAMMQDKDLPNVVILSGTAEVRRAMAAMHNFAKNAQAAIREARVEAGQFGTPIGAAPKKLLRKKKPA